MVKKTIIIFLGLILLVSVVSALGITAPRPQNIQLQPGESTSFNFQIQSDSTPVTCVPVIEESDGLELAFNQEYVVGGNERYVVQPRVIVPKVSKSNTASCSAFIASSIVLSPFLPTRLISK